MAAMTLTITSAMAAALCEPDELGGGCPVIEWLSMFGDLPVRAPTRNIRAGDTS